MSRSIFGLQRSLATFEFQNQLEKAIYDDVKKDYHNEVTETAGFVPLEVRFQKLQENGIRLQLNAQEFDSFDMRKLYLDDEFRVEPDDDLEDIERKVSARAEFLKTLKNKIDVEKKETLQKQNKTSGSNSESKEPDVGKHSAPSDSE